MKTTLTKTPRELAILALVGVAFGYSALNVAIRLMADGFGPYTQTYLRIVLGCLLTVVVFRKELRLEKVRTTSRRDWAVLTLMGTVGYGIAVSFVTLGALNTTLVNVSVLSSTIPFFAAIYTYFALRKRTSGHLLALVLVSFLGASLVATNSFPPLVSHIGKGELYVLLAAAGFAWYSVGRKMLSGHLNNAEISVLTMVIAGVSGIVVAIGRREPLHLHAFTSAPVLIGLAIGSAFNTIATYLENFAFNHISAVSGSQVLLLENAFSPVLGAVFYSEGITTLGAVGAALIIGSVIASARFTKE